MGQNNIPPGGAAGLVGGSGTGNIGTSTVVQSSGVAVTQPGNPQNGMALNTTLAAGGYNQLPQTVINNITGPSVQGANIQTGVPPGAIQALNNQPGGVNAPLNPVAHMAAGGNPFFQGGKCTPQGNWLFGSVAAILVLVIIILALRG